MPSCVDAGVRPVESRPGRRRDSGREDDTAEEDAESLVEGTVASLLQQLEALAAGSAEQPTDQLCDLCDRLHGTLAEADMLGRRCKKRSAILRTLFRLIDLDSARLSLHIATLCLALCVSGKNLLNICKLTFKISRSESNDVLFENNSIIDSLLGVLISEDVCVSGEALLYCVAALKFLSGNSSIIRHLLDKNFIGAAQELIQKLCATEDAHCPTVAHILVQLTVTLRNLADHPDSRPLFVSHSILPELCLVLRQHHQDQDLCTNISRIYSKLSSYSECRHSLAQTPSCYPLFLELLSKHHQKQDFVVRLLFTLGNLTAKSDAARQQLFQSDGCLDTLLQLYDSYQQRDGAPPREPAASLSAREDEDVLVKLVRVLANMCIHPAVGAALANSAACIQLLMETLGLACETLSLLPASYTGAIIDRKTELRSVQESEELLVNVAVTINNLSFYQEDSSVFGGSQLAIAKLMLRLAFSTSMDAMLEATRVYGNLSRSKDVRDFIVQNKVHRFIVTLLDSKSTEMCFSACGVLVNLAVDPPNWACLLLEGAAAKLADCLKDFGAGDWQLAGQICQALWNMIGGGSDQLLDALERDTLLEILSAYSDEGEALKWTENKDVRDFHKACWEFHFLPVAQKLLETLNLSS